MEGGVVRGCSCPLQQLGLLEREHGAFNGLMGRGRLLLWVGLGAVEPSALCRLVRNLLKPSALCRLMRNLLRM
jgi:hypothetical protein